MLGLHVVISLPKRTRSAPCPAAILSQCCDLQTLVCVLVLARATTLCELRNSSCPVHSEHCTATPSLNRLAYGNGEEICGHICSLKDIVVISCVQDENRQSHQDAMTLKLTLKSPPPLPDADASRFMCPLNFKEINRAYPFLYTYTCGFQSSFRTMTMSTKKKTSRLEMTRAQGTMSNLTFSLSVLPSS